MLGVVAHTCNPNSESPVSEGKERRWEGGRKDRRRKRKFQKRPKPNFRPIRGEKLWLLFSRSDFFFTNLCHLFVVSGREAVEENTGSFSKASICLKR